MHTVLFHNNTTLLLELIFSKERFPPVSNFFFVLLRAKEPEFYQAVLRRIWSCVIRTHDLFLHKLQQLASSYNTVSNSDIFCYIFFSSTAFAFFFINRFLLCLVSFFYVSSMLFGVGFYFVSVLFYFTFPFFLTWKRIPLLSNRFHLFVRSVLFGPSFSFLSFGFFVFCNTRVLR